MIYGKKGGEYGHAKRGALMVEKYLSGKDIKEEYKSEILSAILNHSDPKKILSPMHACVVLGDKIHIEKSRVLQDNIKDKGYKMFQSIDATIFTIEKKKNIRSMVIDYKVEEEFKEEIFKYARKYIYLPRMVANYFNMNCIFKVNGEIEAFDKEIWFKKEKK